MKNLLKSVVVVAALFSATAASAQEKVMISDPNWNGARAVGHVIKAIITGQMGGEAEILTGMNQQPVIFAGMDKGDGSIDVHPDMWMPNWQSAWDQYVTGNGTVKTNNGYAGTSLLYVPTYLADKVNSIDDLKNPEIAAMFDTDGDGLGEYWAGDVTWASTKRCRLSSSPMVLTVCGSQMLFLVIPSKLVLPLPMPHHSLSYSTTGHLKRYMFSMI